MPHTLDFAQLSLDAARPTLEAHLSQLPGPIDSFLEDHIAAARHDAIAIDDAPPATITLPVSAGCWYYNHRSKQTLERAGLYSPTRLLRISY